MSIVRPMPTISYSGIRKKLLAVTAALCLSLPLTLTYSDASASTTTKKPSVVKLSNKSKSAKYAKSSKRSTGKVAARNSKLRKLAKSGKKRVYDAASAAIDESKHAALVIDASSGKVLYAKHATDIRHPASLTKMMTLYLTFEALEKGRLKWDQSLPVSWEAAEQDPTNLSLEEGDHITVREAVLGLIIRSANDAAVVLAEAISGSEPRFAKLMTQKAHALGMKDTVYRNASGLPDVNQVTTARDLAVLALALRKHYPQNYKLFSSRSFTFNGRTYDTHNRVMLRYAGADGLKTGYTRMSGFNLVTSANKYGYKLVGVVMGGVSGKSRDDQMITLLDYSFRKIAAASGDGKQFASVDAMGALPGAEEQGEGDIDETASSSTKTADADFAKQATNAKSSKSMNQVALADADDEDDRGDTKKSGGEWGIQVGAYEATKDAFMAAANAKAIASEPLNDAKISVSGTDEGDDKVHRARLTNLTETQAQDACKILIKNKESCFTYKAEAQLAQSM